MQTTALIVTYNRKKLLIDCLSAILSQTKPVNKIIIIDNASTDGTFDELKNGNFLDLEVLEYIPLSENSGGAGGFSYGMEHAFKAGADYIWMMDDDAVPHTDALEKLMMHVTPNHIYGSLAVNGEHTSWTTRLLPENKDIHIKNEIPDLYEVQSLPFLGFLTSKEIYQKIGLPNVSYFIAADDTEYCMRAQQAGFKIYICGRSQIDHPKSERYVFKFLFQELNCLKLVPWKRYYDTRNRVLIGQSYYGLKLYFQTIPSLFVRLLAALINEKNRISQIKAFIFGLYDGLTQKVGKRHDYWNL